MAFAYAYDAKIISPLFQTQQDAEYWYGHEKKALEMEPVLKEVSATILVPIFPGSHSGRTVRW